MSPDSILNRCYRCGRFVPAEGRGAILYDAYFGGYDAEEGRCPPGFGCANPPTPTPEKEQGTTDFTAQS